MARVTRAPGANGGGPATMKLTPKRGWRERPGRGKWGLSRNVLALGIYVEVLQRWLGRDSLAESEAFFSYRRATLEGHGSYGRGLSLIALED